MATRCFIATSGWWRSNVAVASGDEWWRVNTKKPEIPLRLFLAACSQTHHRCARTETRDSIQRQSIPPIRRHLAQCGANDHGKLRECWPSHHTRGQNPARNCGRRLHGRFGRGTLRNRDSIKTSETPHVDRTLLAATLPTHGACEAAVRMIRFSGIPRSSTGWTCERRKHSGRSCRQDSTGLGRSCRENGIDARRPSRPRQRQSLA